MTSAEAELSGRASRRNALVRRLYREFPQVPAGAVADSVLQAWGDLLLAPSLSTSASREEFVERIARERLHGLQRRSELASLRVGLGRNHSRWRHSA